MVVKTQTKKVTNKFRKIVRFIEYYGLQTNQQILALFRMFAHNQEDTKLYRLLMQAIYESPTAKAKRLKNIPFHTPMPQTETQDSIRIGTDEHQRPYHITLNEIIKVVLIAGKIGMGKTYIILNALIEFSKKKIRWHAIDHKRDVRGISTELQKHSPLAFLRFSTSNSNIKYNPLQEVSGLTTNEIDLTFSNLLAESCFLLQGSSFIILQHIAKIRKEKSNPTIQDLIKSIESSKYKSFRENEWRASSLRALISFQTCFSTIIGVEKGIDIVDLFNNCNTVSEVDNAGIFRNFWATYPTALTNKARINQNIRGQKAPLDITVMDEANFGFSKKALEHSTGGMPTLVSILETGREFNLGWLIATNRPADMVDSLKVNASTRVLLFLGDWRNIQDMAGSMGITQAQANHTLTFTPGQAVTKKEGLHAHQITLDNLRTTKEIITDQEIDRISQAIISKYPVVLHTQDAKEKSTLSPLERKMLLQIKNNKIPKSDHAKELRFGKSKADTLFRNLSDLLLEITLPTGKKGRQPTYLILTKKAHEELGIEYESSRGGKEIHDWLTQYYKEQLERERFETKTSLKIGDSKESDLAIIHPSGKKTGIEISDSTTEQWEIDGVTRSLKEFDSFIIITVSPTKAKRLHQKILECPKEVQKKIITTPLVNNLIPLIQEITT